MSMPQGVRSGFSPETFINMHVLKMDEEAEPKVIVLLESLDRVGFDEVNFLNTTTGSLETIEVMIDSYFSLIGRMKQSNISQTLLSYAQGSLISENLLFKCDTDLNACDLWRVSALDAANKKLYFQAHLIDGMSGEPLGIHLVEIGFSYSRATGRLTWYINTKPQELWYGNSGFQFVRFA